VLKREAIHGYISKNKVLEKPCIVFFGKKYLVFPYLARFLLGGGKKLDDE
jgi:hypothetical protein